MSSNVFSSCITDLDSVSCWVEIPVTIHILSDHIVCVNDPYVFCILSAEYTYIRFYNCISCLLNPQENEEFLLIYS